MNAKGAHALVTGGAGAIGAALAVALRARDPEARVSLVDVDLEGLRQQAARVGGDTVTRVWDLARPDELEQRVGDLVSERGPVDTLVNCAGIMEVHTLAAIPWRLAERVLLVDLMSPLRLMSLVAPGMAERRAGVIVNVASMAGLTPLRGCAHYGAAKAGLAMASEVAHLELAPRGVRVVTVYPGPVRSPLEQRARGQLASSLWARMAPTGESSVLAARVVAAIDRGSARVVYPGVYDLASRFPTVASRLARALSPTPRA